MRSAQRTTHYCLPMENTIIGLIALACFVYLILAVLRPEKF
jgi:K+-transporting ATPase KdpF subunit